MRSAAPQPRGLRNANPGNIRRGGGIRYRGERAVSTDPEFRQFESPEWGYRALFVLLYTYGRRYGLQTPRELIARWAPPSENRTDAYVERVCRLTGCDPDRPVDRLDPAVMIPFAKAVSAVENGCPADPEAVARGWALFFADFGPK